MPARSIVVLGGGFVGVTTAVVLAQQGHAVRLVEVAPSRLEALRAGRLPFHEPGLKEALAQQAAGGRLAVHADLGAKAPDAAFLCVGTPSRKDGSCDTSQVEGAARAIAAAGWAPGFTVIVKSTVPPGTTRGVVLPALQRLGEPGQAFGLAMNPEFLREGSALADAQKPDRVVYGTLDPLARRCLEDLYAREACPKVATDLETAELVKYASNAFLATKVTFANEMANLAERVGVHVDEVMHAVGLDARIGPQFLKAGPGYGGSCFPKDVAALRAYAATKQVPLRLLDAVEDVNRTQPERVVALAQSAAGGLRGKTVAMLGLAFKQDTSDVRETRALPIVQGLLAAGAQVRCHDPWAGPEFLHLLPSAQLVQDAAACLKGADLAVLHTPWAEYQALATADVARSMRHAVVVDTRRFFDPAKARAAGFQVHALGVGAREPEGLPQAAAPRSGAATGGRP